MIRFGIYLDNKANGTCMWIGHERKGKRVQDLGPELPNGLE